ncbi:hypothetical protein [Cryptosporangium sp. NPDC051539]|uniref:hypothetical protein n=1 Tax=Cryptosporangium sp. NPDC051539 TaxID=3363962 RepID=UPI0037984197
MYEYPAQPPPAQRPVAKHRAPEPKVTWATIGSYVAGVVGLTILQFLDADLTLLAWLPDPIETAVVPLVPAAAAFIAGYRTRHQARPGDVARRAPLR